MKYIRSMCLLVISLCVFSPAQANEALLNHVKATSQSMSAFYMQILSEGNDKYLQDFNKFKNQSTTGLKQYVHDNGPQAEELLQRWQDLSERLVFTYDNEFGWEVDGRVRQDFRAYLSDIFQLVDIQKKNYTSKPHMQLLSVVQMEALSARFFDVSSSFNVKISIPASDVSKLPPKSINNDFKTNLDTLASMSDSEAAKRQLASIKSKWEFVENTVVNYEGHGAYFVVYATKNKIQQALAAH
jgi:hypothetical protein